MNREPVILVVDDERDHADGVVESLDKLCTRTIAVYNLKDASEIMTSEKIDVVITDLRLDGRDDGLTVLSEARRHNPDCEVILITAYATIETCKEAIRQGAYDYITKPIDISQLRTLTEEACRRVLAKYSRSRQSQRPARKFEFEGVIGSSSRMEHIFEVLRRVAPANISVLIEGQSGTGKELLARAIHKNSQRASEPFRPVNCAGLTESLLESELFGHARGAFTGATADRKGLFEIADKGTLFLDEIGDMPLNMQAKLLRVIEDGIVIPVGSNKPTVVDVRLISATNHDLTELVERNKFRQDLYFRIKGVSIEVPSLSERPEDIPVFISFFIKEAAAETGSSVNGITPAAREILSDYSWPGNIRQLNNCIKTMVVMCDRQQLDVQDIPAEIHQVRQLTAAGRAAGDLSGVSLDELEKQAIIDTLNRTCNNREKAAIILGIGQRTLYRKIKQYNL